MTTFDDILNFIIPPAVIGFIIFIIYRIPLVKKGVDSLIDWIRNKREQSNRTGGSVRLNTIQYE